MTDIHITSLTEAPDREKMNALLMGYYTGIIAALVSVGGPNVDPNEPIADFWAHLDEFLPPDGCLLVAKQGERWVGTGALRTLPGKRGELKRLFVLPETRGTGLGRELVTRRIAFARQLGLTRLVVDTLTPTHAMQALYASLGFTQTEFYPESASYVAFPQLHDHMLFFQKDITP